MSQRDVSAALREVWSLPTTAAAGTVSSTAFKLGGATSARLSASCGAATGAPSAQSATAKLMVADDNGSGAPGSFAPYTGPDGVAAQVALTADNTTGYVSVHLEGSDTKVWARVDVVTAFTSGTTPKLPSSAVLVFNDTKTPAGAVVFAS